MPNKGILLARGTAEKLVLREASLSDEAELILKWLVPDIKLSEN